MKKARGGKPHATVPLTLTLTGLVTLDLPFFEVKILRKTLSVKNVLN
jgi:hypothetical protein